MQDEGEQENSRDEGAREELGCAELFRAQVPKLLIARQVVPVYGEVVQLDSVDSDEHHHGVGYAQPPERFEQLLLQAIYSRCGRE